MDNGKNRITTQKSPKEKVKMNEEIIYLGIITILNSIGILFLLIKELRSLIHQNHQSRIRGKK